MQGLKNANIILVGKSEGRECLEDLNINGRIILK